MSSLNAVILPDVINFIFAKKGVLDSATRKQIIERKTQLTTASAQDAIQDLKQCQKCSAEVNDSQEFCAKCGYSLITKESSVLLKKATQEEKVISTESGSSHCVGCGSLISKDSKFCGNCGKANISN